MFNFFKKKNAPDSPRKNPSDSHKTVDARARNESDVTNEKANTVPKDVVNLLIPETDYNQKSGVGAILQIMAGKKRKNKKKRTESCRMSPQKETQVNLQRSNSDVEPRGAPTPAENKQDTDAAEFVKALVLQKYAAKPDRHVSLVYVNEPVLDEKRHAEALLREIARSIDCTIDKINENQMGATDSKEHEPVYEAIDRDNGIDTYKNELKGELEKLLQIETDIDRADDSPALKKKSNLKPPKSDTEGCSDDDRSDSGKKRVTFRKHIVFDDGEQQTDEEVDSSFESLTSEEEYLEESIPDNDELLGGYVVSRSESDNKTVINVNEDVSDGDKVQIEGDLKRISSDNSDSGFIEGDSELKSVEVESDSDVSTSETEEEITEEEEEEEVSIAEIIEPGDPKHIDHKKSLVTQESKFQSQVAVLTELADNRCGESERARELIAAYRKEIEAKDQEIEHLKCELAAAYKESELVRQRSRSLEEDLSAARSCSADLAEQLQRRNDESLRQLRSELDDALTRRAELESRVLALERDKDRLEQEKVLQEQKAQEALAAAEANTAKWRSAHESARSQAAARAERMLADCEWKMRELEKKARDAEKQKKELANTVEQLQSAPPTPAHIAELQQLRGLATEQQRSVEALKLQLQTVETREEALKLEVHRLKEVLDKETRIGKEKEERYLQSTQRLEQRQSEALERARTEQAAARAHLERAAAERTRAALGQLRAEADVRARSADRKLRELTTRFENLKEVLASKESQFEREVAEAHSKADWDILQLRHLLDKADINYANNIEQMTERFEKEKERLIEEWSTKLRQVEEEASTAAGEAKQLLETTRSKLVSERLEQVNKLKEQHRLEMEEQWEQFMTDKESCLTRMKSECRQEGEEERVKREKELLEEIAELKSQVQSKSSDFDTLAVKAAACGRTLAVTEQELREALAREKELREKRSEDTTKIRQMERAGKEQIEHLTRKCACLRKLFDDMRARLTARDRAAGEETRAKDKEISQLRAEVARLTKILVEQSSPKLGARTRADGCEHIQPEEAASETPRRKGM
ncbi:golgin subfamily A member 6-like protein 22 isoform X2 [Achroia grisella]|uniref:golgin subfamily A member 6-like protein 22 isoform X2 n=1 Tax=Achroia grisella TaxID=688607 RepID=UPI0027D1EC49|nr:golgin subfamily A member 6-like protein 22 isoform X2 [Achroia grisella]